MKSTIASDMVFFVAPMNVRPTEQPYLGCSTATTQPSWSTSYPATTDRPRRRYRERTKRRRHGRTVYRESQPRTHSLGRTRASISLDSAGGSRRLHAMTTLRSALFTSPPSTQPGERP